MTESRENGPSSIGRQAITLVIATVVSQGMFALIYLVAARSASVDEFGSVVAAIALGTAAAGYFDFGTNSLWIREHARGILKQANLRAPLIGKLTVAGVLATAWCVALAILNPASPLWLAGPAGFALLASQTLQVPLRGSARIERVAIAIVIDRVSVLIFLLALTAATVPLIFSFGLSMVVGPMVSAAMCVILTPAQDRVPLFGRFQLVNPWRGAAAYGTASAAVSSQSLDIPLMNALSGSDAAGAYGAVNKWLQPFGMLANSFASVSVPHVARANSMRAAFAHARRSSWLLLIAVLGCVTTIPLAPLAVNILLGQEYAQSVPVLQVLAFGMIAAVLNQPIASFLQARGKDRAVSIVVVAGVGLQLATVVALASPLGAISGAIAYAVMQFVLLAVLTGLAIIYARRENGPGVAS